MKHLNVNSHLARPFVAALALLSSTCALADNISGDQALQLARQFVTHRAPASEQRHAPAATQQVTPAGQVSGLYVFNVGSDGGFVIVSNDDRTTPVLGFSDSGHLDTQNIPSNMRAWLQGYADEIAWLQKQSTKNKPKQIKAPRRLGTHSTVSIYPMLTSKWNQGTPYNNLAPYYKDNGGSLSYSATAQNGYSHCVTGCAATAMAQLMYYHKWPQSATTVIPGYTWEKAGFNLSGLPSTTFDWSNMLDSYNNGYSATQGDAVAKLMQYCGWSLKMDYGKDSGASTQDVEKALESYFGYNETTQYVSRLSYNDANWTDLIYFELANRRPVLYAGQSSGGGHGFVCDGYERENNEDYFHINWGWGGMSDSYFTLSNLNPYEQGYGGSSTQDGFNNSQEAIIGIQRSVDTGTMSDIKPKEINLTLNSMTLSDNTAIVNSEVTVTFSVTNNSEDDFENTICLGRLVEYSMSFLQNDIFTIPAGETKELEFRYTPTEAGTYDIYIYWFNENDEFKYGNSHATLTVTDGVIPIDLSVSDVTSSGATLGWTSNEATSYNVRYRTAGRDAVVFFDDFENGLSNWTVYKEGEAPINGWDAISASNLNIEAQSGEKVVLAMSYNNNQAYNADNWLVTPQMTFGNELKFWVLTAGNWPDSYEVLLSSTGKAIADFTVTLKEMATAPGEWTEVTIDLSDYQGEQGYIAIHHVSSDCFYLVVDDFGVYAEAQEPGEWASVSATEQSVKLTGLDPETTYECQVQAIYGAESSEWSESATFTTLPCPLVELSDNATDISSTLGDYSGEKVDVTLSGRTLYKDGAWNTICLPFDLVLKGSPLEDATAKTLADATMTGTHVTLTFGEAVSELKAGVPYIIKWEEGEDIVEPTFTNVTVTATEGQTIEKAGGNVKFIGYYDAFGITAADEGIYYMTAGNTLKHTAKDRQLKALRAYFRFTEAAAARSFVLDFGDGDVTTAISSIDTDARHRGSEWYSLDGMKHSQQPAQKGVYVKDGKKIVVK